MHDTFKEFEQLDIDGLLLLKMMIVPQRKLVLTVFGARTTDEPVREYDIQFNKMHVIDIDVRSFGDNKITSHSVVPKSELLNNYLSDKVNRARQQSSVKPIHFQISFEGGEINVLAETFAHSLTWDAK